MPKPGTQQLPNHLGWGHPEPPKTLSWEAWPGSGAGSSWMIFADPGVDDGVVGRAVGQPFPLAPPAHEEPSLQPAAVKMLKSTNPAFGTQSSSWHPASRWDLVAVWGIVPCVPPGAGGGGRLLAALMALAPLEVSA